ncbi:MAG: DUF3795 domain-containing protein [Actinomycetota bacterium]
MSGGNGQDPRRYIGCCGAYCKTCKPYIEGVCKGCKLGFDTGERDIGRARCQIKLCCFAERGLATCADCPELDTCTVLGGLYAKKGYKYGKYRQAIEFIRDHGYPEFIRLADRWKNAYGKLE